MPRKLICKEVSITRLAENISPISVAGCQRSAPVSIKNY